MATNPITPQGLTALLAQQVAHANTLAVQSAATGMHDSDYDFLGGALDAAQALLELTFGNSAYGTLEAWATADHTPPGHDHSPPLSMLAAPDCLCPPLVALARQHGHLL